MLVGRFFTEGNIALQDKVQRHYGSASGLVEASVVAADSINSLPQPSPVANPAWQAAFAEAMSRTGALVEVQMSIAEREAALKERERKLAQREKALTTTNRSAEEILPWRAMLATTGR